ncbi:hypothetical protein ACSBR2_024219 [Camellia fascicularis]
MASNNKNGRLSKHDSPSDNSICAPNAGGICIPKSSMNKPKKPAQQDQKPRDKKKKVENALPKVEKEIPIM